MSDSNVGKWDAWYKGLSANPSSFRYGDTLTYQLGARFLEDCEVVEDWGTGAGGFLRYRPDAIGVDGSDTPHAKKKFVDLVTYETQCDGIFMRHVLEHNYDWTNILKNALTSARKICIVLFTPLSDGPTKELAHNKAYGVDVPDLSLSKDVLMINLKTQNFDVKIEEYKTQTDYGAETVLYLTRTY